MTVFRWMKNRNKLQRADFDASLVFQRRVDLRIHRFKPGGARARGHDGDVLKPGVLRRSVPVLHSTLSRPIGNPGFGVLASDARIASPSASLGGSPVSAAKTVKTEAARKAAARLAKLLRMVTVRLPEERLYQEHFSTGAAGAVF